MKKKIIAIIIIIVLVLIMFPNRLNVKISEEDMQFLSNFPWDDKAVLQKVGFTKYSEDGFTLDYDSGCLIRLTFEEEVKSNEFSFEVYDTINCIEKFELWFAKNPQVQRKAEGSYKNVTIVIHEITAHRKDNPKFIEVLKGGMSRYYSTSA